MIKGAIAHKEDTRSAQIPTENEQARGSRQARRNWTRKPMISKHKAAENKFLLTSQCFTCYSFSLATYLKKAPVGIFLLGLLSLSRSLWICSGLCLRDMGSVGFKLS